MPFGALKTNGSSIPQFAPPYTVANNEFSGVNILTVPYRTTYESVRHLVPEELELADEPLVSASIVDYGMSTVGAYKEYVHLVEVTYKGEVFDYCLSLILNNESAILSGREQFGYPKRLGSVSWIVDSGSSIMHGHVQRPVGQNLLRFNYSPTQKLHDIPNGQRKRTLNLRVIPSPIPNQPPSVKELVPVDMKMTADEVWLCSASISFPEPSEHDPMHKIKILRYEPATFIRNATAELEPPAEVFPL